MEKKSEKLTWFRLLWKAKSALEKAWNIVLETTSNLLSWENIELKEWTEIKITQEFWIEYKIPTWKAITWVLSKNVSIQKWEIITICIKYHSKREWKEKEYSFITSAKEMSTNWNQIRIESKNDSIYMIEIEKEG